MAPADDWNERELHTYVDLETPPMGREARIEAGTYLRHVQRRHRDQIPPGDIGPGEFGSRCYKLYIDDHEKDCSWRVAFHIDNATDTVVVLDFYKKKQQTTPQHIIKRCEDRLESWHNAT